MALTPRGYAQSVVVGSPERVSGPGTRPAQRANAHQGPSSPASARLPPASTGAPCETSTRWTGSSSSGRSVRRRSACVRTPSQRSGQRRRRSAVAPGFAPALQQHVAHDQGPLLREPVHDLCRACGLEGLDTAGQELSRPERVGHRDRPAAQRAGRARRRPDPACAERTRCAAVPVDGQEHVVGRRQLGWRSDRIDEHQAVGGVDGDRCDILRPLGVPGRPAAEARSDLGHGSHTGED